MQINPSTDLVFHPLSNKWVVELPDGTKKEFLGGYKARLEAQDFIESYNRAITASA